MAAKKRKLWLLVAAITLIAAPAVFASIPRSEIFAPAAERFAFENAPPARPETSGALPLVDQLRSAADAVWPLASLAETRIRAFDHLAPFEQQEPSELTRAVRQAYAEFSERSASDESFCGGDPVNCSDPTGERGMTAEDNQRLGMLKARGKKLHDDFTSTGRADFEQYLLVPVEHPWWDTSGPIGGDYAQQTVPSTVTTQPAYEGARRSMVNDVATFEAAVARADANGEIYYVAGQGFTTFTAADQQRADRSTMIAAGIFFATDTVPMMLSPAGMRGKVRAEPVVDLGAGPVPVAYADAQAWERSVPNPYGRLGSPAHRARVESIVADIRARGLNTETEVPIPTVNGAKDIRIMDVVARDPATGRIVEVHQVGRGLKSNPLKPVVRERDALRDVRNSSLLRGAKRVFHNYQQ